jgi:ADP-ribosyltransferase exoenzyme
MTSPPGEAKKAITHHFDCSDSKNIGKGGDGGLTLGNIRAIYKYTGQSGDRASEIVNPILRYIAKLPEDERGEYLDNVRKKIGVSSIKTFIHQMDDAISKVQLPADLILYRGVDYEKLIDDLGHALEKGVMFHDAGFMSTSYTETVACRFAVPCIFFEGDIKRRPIFVITTKTGQKGAVSHNECEVILPRGITLQCIDIIDVKDRRYFIMDCLFSK